MQAALGPHEARILDLAGPWEVLTRANEILTEQQPDQKPSYELKLATIGCSELIHCFGQLCIRTEGDFRSLGTGLDTLLVCGGRAPWELPKNDDFLAWLRAMSGRVRRLVAIGSGAFFLVEAGLLQGKRVTTHWRWADRLKKSYPGILVDPAPVFVRDGHVYTGACASVVMDVTLAMVKEDYGQALAGEVAKRLADVWRKAGRRSSKSRPSAVFPVPSYCAGLFIARWAPCQAGPGSRGPALPACRAGASG